MPEWIDALQQQSAGLVALAGSIAYLARLIHAEGNRRQDRAIARMGRRIGALEQTLAARGTPVPQAGEEGPGPFYEVLRAHGYQHEEDLR